jgi:oxygen-independent coproporphyrinogen-3 oxidase
MPLGLYVSVPFCRTKCSYCNFASDVFSKGAFENYVRRVIEDIGSARATAAELGGAWEESADSVYLGGGTPSILEPTQLIRIFDAVRGEFVLTADAEITVECAPGTLSPQMIETLVRCGVNRVSLGVQSFVDQEAQAVGRLHTRSKVLEEIAQLRAAGIANINIDLIAGLPHQTAASWEFSLSETIATGAPHVSVYMLEVDEDSRLGRELIAGGTRYHAHFVPDEEATANFYLRACERLNAAGIAQYEISNFARRGVESRHNLKYWTRQPYLGFGVDAHSMLETQEPRRTQRITEEKPQPCMEAVRFCTPDSLDGYMNHAALTVTPVSARAAFEETFFLGLRLNRGLDLVETGLVPSRSVPHRSAAILAPSETRQAASLRESGVIAGCVEDGLLEREGSIVRLTPRGRLLSNEVFARFLGSGGEVGTGHVNPR